MSDAGHAGTPAAAGAGEGERGLESDPSLAEDLFGFGDEEDMGDTNFLPPFANKENKELDELVKTKERELESVNLAIEESADRIGVMNEHLANVKQELAYTQARVDAKKREYESEAHLKQLCEREGGRIQEEVAQHRREKQELEEKLNSLQKDVYRGTEKLDQFKLLMNWNQEELEQWALASRQKEEDNLALQKYMRADDVRIKELNLHIERMAKTVSAKKEELENEVTETQAAQIMLDKTADDFRQLHLERQNLLRQWEEAIEAMKRRDQAIQQASELFADRKQELREKQMQLDAQARFLENEEVNNKELDMNISMNERAVGKLREELSVKSAKVNDLTEEVEVLKNTLAKTHNQLANEQTSAKNLRIELENKRDKQKGLEDKFKKIQDSLQSEIGQLQTLDERNAHFQKLHAAEEQKLKDVKKQGVALKDEMFKAGQQLFTLRTKERDLIAEIAGGQSQNKNMTSKVSQLDAYIIKQQQMLYNASFNVQQLERKVARAGGERSDEETRVLNQRIQKLNKILEGVNAEYNLLSSQVKLAEENLKSASRTKMDFVTSQQSLESSLAELKLETETTLRSVKEKVKEKEDKLVASDILQLEVKRLRDILTMRSDEVYGLENRKEQLQMSIEERKHEVEVHKETLQAQLKILQEDIHRVTLEKKEKEMRIEKLQSKFEVTKGRVQGAGGDDGEEKSQAYFVIKAAQEREELQREGDGLDAEIAKAEKEVRALENTLQKLLGKNAAYRTSFRRVDQRKITEVTTSLREKLDRSYDRMKTKRAEERQLQADVDQAEARVDTIQEDIKHKLSHVSGVREEMEGVEGEMAELGDRLARSLKRLEVTEGQLAGSGSPLAMQKEVALKEIEELNLSALQELRNLSSLHPKSGIIDKITQAGIRIT